MAYENIRCEKPHMTIVDGYFYHIDEGSDVLVQRTDDGDTVFNYPLSSVLPYALTSFEHDGVNFWSMYNITNGVSIGKWKIENYNLMLKKVFEFTPNFTSETFTVEHYHDTLYSGILVSGVQLYLNEYISHVTSGTLLTIGPNSSGYTEEVIVNTVSGSCICLASGVQYTYDEGAVVNFYNHLWVFNDVGDGTLHKIDAYTGENLITYSGTEYKNITACTFSKVEEVEDHPVDVLVYEKDTNLKFLNVYMLQR